MKLADYFVVFLLLVLSEDTKENKVKYQDDNQVN